MSRFPPIPDNQLTDAQKRTADSIDGLFSRFPDHIVNKNDDGVILGPYSSLFYTEDVSDAWFTLASSVMRQQRLKFREKELCILAVLAEYEVPYVRYAHLEIALHAGFEKDQVEQAMSGTLPENLTDERESAVYTLALKMVRLCGPLDEQSFEQARLVLGRDGVAGVAHVVSGYIYVAMLSNISGTGAPNE